MGWQTRLRAAVVAAGVLGGSGLIVACEDYEHLASAWCGSPPTTAVDSAVREAEETRALAETTGTAVPAHETAGSVVLGRLLGVSATVPTEVGHVEPVGAAVAVDAPVSATASPSTSVTSAPESRAQAQSAVTGAMHLDAPAHVIACRPTTVTVVAPRGMYPLNTEQTRLSLSSSDGQFVDVSTSGSTKMRFDADGSSVEVEVLITDMATGSSTVIDSTRVSVWNSEDYLSRVEAGEFTARGSVPDDF